MAIDLVDESRWKDNIPPDGLTEFRRFSQSYPTVPLDILIREVRHAQRAVAAGSEDRATVVNQIVRSRLARYAADDHAAALADIATPEQRSGGGFEWPG